MKTQIKVTRLIEYISYVYNYQYFFLMILFILIGHFKKEQFYSSIKISIMNKYSLHINFILTILNTILYTLALQSL